MDAATKSIAVQRIAKTYNGKLNDTDVTIMIGHGPDCDECGNIIIHELDISLDKLLKMDENAFYAHIAEETDNGRDKVIKEADGSVKFLCDMCAEEL